MKRGLSSDGNCDAVLGLLGRGGRNKGLPGLKQENGIWQSLDLTERRPS